MGEGLDSASPLGREIIRPVAVVVAAQAADGGLYFRRHGDGEVVFSVPGHFDAQVGPDQNARATRAGEGEEVFDDGHGAELDEWQG